MNDQFLNDLRRDPRPEFVAGVRERLRRHGAAAGATRSALLGRGLRPALAVAAALAVVAAVVFSPTVRAYATAFLDLFRVRNFAAVAINPERMERLRALNTAKDRDPALVLFDRVETLRDPGKPVVYPDPLAAGAAAGIDVHLPGTLVNGLVADTVEVMGEGEARLTVNARKLSGVLEALGITDISVPPGIDGAQATVHLHPAVNVVYKRDKFHANLIQARSPEVSLPQGLDLEQLGEIGLRIAGLDRDEARRFARTIDWHSTLLVPVPANASSFREVDVRGRKGLMITTQGAPAGTRFHGRRGAMLIWSDDDRVYGFCGNMAGEDLLVMANSMR